MSIDLIPAPISLTGIPGVSLALNAGTTLASAPELAPARRLLAETLRAATGWDFESAPADQAVISLQLPAHDDGPDLGAEGYRLSVDGSRVLITAADVVGASHAVHTLLQLLGPAALRRAPGSQSLRALPGVVIQDAPRFAYRGVMLDVARHFMPKRAVLDFISAVALHKINVVHLHLTDDQGWRVEIKAFPLLTEVGASRSRSSVGDWRAGVYDSTPHGGFYTQEDLREIVAFAAARNITVIPEIDVPGHSQSAIAAYPWLAGLEESPGVWDRWGINYLVLDPSERTLDFYRTILDELVDIFPGQWFSLGGDEVPPNQWQANPVTVKQAAELGFDSVAGLHSWFIGQLSVHLAKLGRKVAVWDEIGDGVLPEDALVHSWRGFEGGLSALAAGRDVVMCPESVLYLDYPQSDSELEPVPVGVVTDLRKVYDFEPLPADYDGDTSHLLGAQVNVWTEHLDNPRRVDFATFPRLAAAAEAFWTPAELRDFDGFMNRLEQGHLPRLAAAGVEFRPLEGPLPWQQRPGVVGRMHQAGHQAGVDEAAGTESA